MSNELLKKLFDRMSQEGINDKIIKQNINYLSNNEIEIILESKYFKVLLLLFTNNDFRRLNSDLKEEIAKQINKAKTEKIAEYASSLVMNISILKNRKVFELVVAVSESIGEEQAKWACDTAKRYIDFYEIVEIVKIISQSVGKEQADYAIKIVASYGGVTPKQVLKLSEKISKAKEIDQAYWAYDVLRNGRISTYDVAMDIVDIIIKTQDTKKLRYIYFMACDRDIIKNKNAVGFARTISTAAGVEQASCVFYALKIEHVREDARALEIVKTISKAKGEKQASQAIEFLKDEEVLESNLLLNVLRKICQAKDEKKLQSIFALAKDENVYSSGKILTIIKIINSIDNSNIIDAITNVSFNLCEIIMEEKELKIIIEKNLSEILGLISKSRNYDRLSDIFSVYSSITLFESGIFIEIAKAIDEFSNEEQARYAYHAAYSLCQMINNKSFDEKISEKIKNSIIVLMKLVGSSASVEQKENELLLATDDWVLKIEGRTGFVNEISQTQDSIQSRCIADAVSDNQIPNGDLKKSDENEGQTFEPISTQKRLYIKRRDDVIKAINAIRNGADSKQFIHLFEGIGIWDLYSLFGDSPKIVGDFLNEMPGDAYITPTSTLILRTGKIKEDSEN